MGSDSWTTIGIKKTTKARLDENRAPGQNYDGFIWQLVDLWEKTKSKLNDNRASDKDYDNLIMQLTDLRESTENERVGSAGGNQGAEAIRSQTA